MPQTLYASPDLCLDSDALERCYSRFKDVLREGWPVSAVFELLLGQIREPYKVKLLTNGFEIETLKTWNQQLEEQNHNLTQRAAELEERNHNLTQRAAELEERNNNLEEQNRESAQKISRLYDENIKARKKLEAFFFSQPLVKPMLFLGSVSRAEAWKVVKNLPSYLGTGDLPGSTTIIQQVHEHAGHHILAARHDRYQCETDLYEPMVSLLKRYFECSLLHSTSNQDLEWCPEACVLDTHNKKYLDSNAPDVSIFLQGTTQPEPSSLCVVIDMKYSARIGSDEDMGQIYDYLLHMRRAQPGRKMLVGVLSNLDSNIVLTMESGSDPHIVRHKPVGLQHLIVYLATVALTEQAYRPPDLGFAPALGNMIRRLGAPTNNDVAIFKIPGQTKTMAVKRSVGEGQGAVSREAELLRRMALHANKPESIPDLVYLFEDDTGTGTPKIEFGIYPVGATLEPGIFPNHRQFSTALQQILKALHWLHNSALLIHRDVRSDNIVLHPTRGAVLIDFDNAFDNSIPGETIYRGGYICCPPTHIRTVASTGCWLEMYTPQPAHDYLAWLLLVNCLLFPAPMGWMRSNKIASPEGRLETERILALWEALEASPFWGKYVTAAENEDVDTLQGVLDVIVHL